jgi:phosphomannomutase/phosphoglucomutase
MPLRTILCPLASHEDSMRAKASILDMFKAVDGVLRTHPEVGEYNQTI